MTPNSMYENLMTLPLFKGVSYSRLSEIVGNTRLAFLKYLPDENMFEAGQPCTHIKFIISGHVRMTIRNDSDRVRVSQDPRRSGRHFARLPVRAQHAISRLGHSHRHGVDNAD